MIVKSDYNYFHVEDIIPLEGKFAYTSNRCGRVIYPEEGSVFVIPKDGVVRYICSEMRDMPTVPKGCYTWVKSRKWDYRAEYRTSTRMECGWYEQLLNSYGIEVPPYTADTESEKQK